MPELTDQRRHFLLMPEEWPCYESPEPPVIDGLQELRPDVRVSRAYAVTAAQSQPYDERIRSHDPSNRRVVFVKSQHRVLKRPHSSNLPLGTKTVFRLREELDSVVSTPLQGVHIDKATSGIAKDVQAVPHLSLQWPLDHNVAY